MEEVLEPVRRGRKRLCECGACPLCKQRECGRRYRALHPEEHAKYVSTRPEHVLLASARYRAKHAGLEFSIDAADIVIPEFCPVFGMRLGRGTGVSNVSPSSPSLDRIEAGRGYVKGNIWVISHKANRIKNEGTPEEHRRIADAVEAQLAKEPRFSINPFV